MSDVQGSATVAKWTRKVEKLEDDDKSAREKMKAAIAGAMRDPKTHENLSRELLNARQGGGTPMKSREAYGDDGEVFTGISEDQPWKRE